LFGVANEWAMKALIAEMIRSLDPLDNLRISAWTIDSMKLIACAFVLSTRTRQFPGSNIIRTSETLNQSTYKLVIF
jgi:hypothetical protein